jgi:hypothetical protein
VVHLLAALRRIPIRILLQQLDQLNGELARFKDQATAREQLIGEIRREQAIGAGLIRGDHAKGDDAAECDRGERDRVRVLSDADGRDARVRSRRDLGAVAALLGVAGRIHRRQPRPLNILLAGQPSSQGMVQRYADGQVEREGDADGAGQAGAEIR